MEYTELSRDINNFKQVVVDHANEKLPERYGGKKPSWEVPLKTFSKQNFFEDLKEGDIVCDTYSGYAIKRDGSISHIATLW